MFWSGWKKEGSSIIAFRSSPSTLSLIRKLTMVIDGKARNLHERVRRMIVVVRLPNLSLRNLGEPEPS